MIVGRTTVRPARPGSRGDNWDKKEEGHFREVAESGGEPQRLAEINGKYGIDMQLEERALGRHSSPGSA